MTTRTVELFWPETQTTPPEELEEKLAVISRKLCLLKQMTAASSDLFMPRFDDHDYMKFLRIQNYDHEKTFSLLKMYFQQRDSEMLALKSPPSHLVIASNGKDNLYWPEIWTTPSDEIGEKLITVKEELQLLKQKIADDPSLIVALEDDNFLLRFLRVKKYNHKRAFILMQNYFRIRASHSKLFQNFIPSSMQKCFTKGIYSISLQLDTRGRAVAILRAGRWDPSLISAEEGFRSTVMCFEAASLEPLLQITGIVGVMDLKNIGLRHLRHLTPYLMIRYAETLLRAFPLKVKSINIINEPAIFDVVFTVIKPFLGQKMQSRIHFHGTNLASLHKQIPPEFLPEDYGGHLETVGTEGVLCLMLQQEDNFRKFQRYGYLSEIDSAK